VTQPLIELPRPVNQHSASMPCKEYSPQGILVALASRDTPKPSLTAPAMGH
jgi:hypothetical protein